MIRVAVARVIEMLRSGELAERYADLVDVRRHPSGGLALLNYTHECQFGRHWDDVTRVCRGLIVDTDRWAVAAWPFAKFFNVGERPETQPEALPAEPFLVFEKLDGSLGISYRAPDGPALASRGAFASDQARRGTELLRALPGAGRLPGDVTFLFEIIYAENRSVVRYPFDGLVLLAAVDTATGEELPWDQVAAWADRLGCRAPRVYPFGTLADVLASRAARTADLEGYVIRFASGLRVKLKGEAYLTLHKLVWGLSEKRVGEALEAGTYADLLREMPEEFRGEVEAMAEGFRRRAAALEAGCRALFARAPAAADRKTFALWVQANVAIPLRAALFALLDGREPNWFALLRRLDPPNEEPPAP